MLARLFLSLADSAISLRTSLHNTSPFRGSMHLLLFFSTVSIKTAIQIEQILVTEDNYMRMSNKNY